MTSMRKIICLLFCAVAFAATAAEPIKPMTNATNQTELATLGGGCFWCLEAAFERLAGVKSVVSGYAGGHTEFPTYEQVCAHITGHAEVVQIEFDPAQISFEKILETFWEIHDPTTLNRQGADVGEQYRSIILYHSDAQKASAEKSKAAAAKQYPNPIVTHIEPLKKFWKAEAGHQDYYRLNPNAGYCRVVVKPKPDKLERKHATPKP